jgi:hypothetical protein
MAARKNGEKTTIERVKMKKQKNNGLGKTESKMVCWVVVAGVAQPTRDAVVWKEESEC